MTLCISYNRNKIIKLLLYVFTQGNVVLPCLQNATSVEYCAVKEIYPEEEKGRIRGEYEHFDKEVFFTVAKISSKLILF